jgi:hypothetical protein
MEPISLYVRLILFLGFTTSALWAQGRQHCEAILNLRFVDPLGHTVEWAGGGEVQLLQGPRVQLLTDRPRKISCGSYVLKVYPKGCGLVRKTMDLEAGSHFEIIALELGTLGSGPSRITKEVELPAKFRSCEGGWLRAVPLYLSDRAWNAPISADGVAVFSELPAGGYLFLIVSISEDCSRGRFFGTVLDREVKLGGLIVSQ